MSLIRLQVRQPIDSLNGLVEALEQPFAGSRGKEAIATMRESVLREFQSSSWSLPDGGQRSWEATKPFGTRTLPATPLGGTSGFMSLAWQGGPFGFEEQSGRRVAIGVSHPAAPVHRGGDDPQPNQVTILQITPKMRRFVGATYGAGWPNEQTEFEVPSRPHATRNPVLEQALAAKFAEAIVLATKRGSA